MSLFAIRDIDVQFIRATVDVLRMEDFHDSANATMPDFTCPLITSIFRVNENLARSFANNFLRNSSRVANFVVARRANRRFADGRTIANLTSTR